MRVVFGVVVAVVAALLPGPAVAQSNPNPEPGWVQRDFGIDGLFHGTATGWVSAVAYGRDDTIYVAGEAQERIDFGEPGIAWVAALDATTGRILWGPVNLTPNSDLLHHVGDLVVTDDGAALVIAMADADPFDAEGVPAMRLVKVDTNSGETLWRSTWATDNFSWVRGLSVSPDGTRLAVAAANAFRPGDELVRPGGAFAIVEMATGIRTVQQTTPDESWLAPPVWVDDTRVVLGGFESVRSDTISTTGLATSLDPATGGRHWTWSARPAPANYPTNAPLELAITDLDLAPGRVVATGTGTVVDLFGYHASLQPDNGVQQWEEASNASDGAVAQAHVVGDTLVTTAGRAASTVALADGTTHGAGYLDDEFVIDSVVGPDGTILGATFAAHPCDEEVLDTGWVRFTAPTSGVAADVQVLDRGLWGHSGLVPDVLAYDPSTTRFVLGGSRNTCDRAQPMVAGHRLVGTDPCTEDVKVFGVRGSGQSPLTPIPASGRGPTEVGDSMGPQVTDYFNRLEQVLTERGMTATWEGITYPAVHVTWSLFTGGTFYVASMLEGKNAIQVAVDHHHARCPDQPIVLAGYSQGADVVGTFMEWTGSATASTSAWKDDLVGAILFADPKLNNDEPGVTGNLWTGWRAWQPSGILGDRSLVPAEFTDRFVSYCLSNDIVCTSDGGVSAHTAQYTRDVAGWGITTQIAAERTFGLWLAHQARNRTYAGAGNGPLADAAGPYQRQPGLPVTVGGNGSRPGSPLGRIVNYDFAVIGSTQRQDGPSPTFTVTFDTTGTYQVQLTVTDDLGGTDTTTTQVQVTPTAPTPPAAVSGVTVTPVRGGVALAWDPPPGDVDRYVVADTDAGHVLAVTSDPAVTVPTWAAKDVDVWAVGPAGPGPAITVQALPGSVANEAVTRTGSHDPAATSAAVADLAFPNGADTVVVTRSDAYPDALAASGVAGAHNAPVLLTPPDSLHDDVVAAIDQLQPDRAIILGGEAAISPAVEDALVGLGLDVERLAGPTRFATAAAAARSLDHVLVVEGGNADPQRGWPDAVGVAGVAAALGHPIVLVERDRLPEETAALLRRAGSATIVGGTAAVSGDVEAQIRAIVDDVERIAGATRFQTSLTVADAHNDSGVADTGNVWTATALDWRDALVAGPAAAATSSLFVLLNTSGGDLGPQETLDWIGDVADTVIAVGDDTHFTSEGLEQLHEAVNR